MKKIKIITQKVEIVDDVICNKCGESCMSVDDDFKTPYGLNEVVVSGGYYSNYLEDLTTYTFSLCEKCLSELFKTFLIPVHKSGLYENYERKEDE